MIIFTLNIKLKTNHLKKFVLLTKCQFVYIGEKGAAAVKRITLAPSKNNYVQV